MNSTQQRNVLVISLQVWKLARIRVRLKHFPEQDQSYETSQCVEPPKSEKATRRDRCRRARCSFAQWKVCTSTGKKYQARTKAAQHFRKIKNLSSWVEGDKRNLSVQWLCSPQPLILGRLASQPLFTQSFQPTFDCKHDPCKCS